MRSNRALTRHMNRESRIVIEERMNRISVSFLGLVLTITLIGCGTPTETGQAPGSSEKMGAPPDVADHELINELSNFARDQGELGKAAWQRLTSYPRQKLVDLVLHLGHEGKEDEVLVVNIAFLLCNIDYEYEANRDALVRFFSKGRAEADYSEQLLARLIRRGDMTLLTVLFSASDWSDGGLSESLADTFAQQLRQDTRHFLFRIKGEPQNRRWRVFALLHSALPPADVKKIQKDISSIPNSAPIAKVANELRRELMRNVE